MKDLMKKFFEKIKCFFKMSRSAATVAVLCAIAVLLAGGFCVYSVAYEKILPNVCVEGLNLGGMDKSEAARCVTEEFGDIASGRGVRLVCRDNEISVLFDELGARVDGEKTAETAFAIGREKGILRKIFTMLKLAFKDTRAGLSISLDSESLNKIITGLAEQYEVPPVDTGYRLNDNKLTVIKGKGGVMVDRDKAKTAVIEAITDSKITEVYLEPEETAPQKVDVDKFYARLTQSPKDAEYIYENGTVSITPEIVGIRVSKEEIKKALQSEAEEYTLTVEVEEPKVFARQLEELLFRDVMGSFSSSFASSTEARASNVRLTAQRINGFILMPGDVFSYDKTIGSRTRANGYKEAGVYVGNKVESGIGGGICQTSSTLYSAALYANLEIVSRTSHSLPVSYVPAGQDATIAEGYIDLKIKNNTEYPVKIIAAVNGRRLTCSILGVKVDGQTVELRHSRISTTEPSLERTENKEIPQGYKYVVNKGANGYTIASERIVRLNGETVKNERLTRSVYNAAPIEEEVNPADMNTPSENLKAYIPGVTVLEDTVKNSEPEEEIEEPKENETEEADKAEGEAEEVKAL